MPRPKSTLTFKSEAQRKKFVELLESKKITQELFEKYEKASKGLKLPDRVKK